VNLASRPAPHAHRQRTNQPCHAGGRLHGGQRELIAAAARQDHRRHRGEVGQRRRKVHRHEDQHQSNQSGPLPSIAKAGGQLAPEIRRTGCLWLRARDAHDRQRHHCRCEGRQIDEHHAANAHPQQQQPARKRRSEEHAALRQRTQTGGACVLLLRQQQRRRGGVRRALERLARTRHRQRRVEMPDFQRTGEMQQQERQRRQPGARIRRQHHRASIEPVDPDAGKGTHQQRRQKGKETEKRHGCRATGLVIRPDQQRKPRHSRADLRDELPAPDHAKGLTAIQFHRSPLLSGRMLALRRNRLSGSYLILSAANRA